MTILTQAAGAHVAVKGYTAAPLSTWGSTAQPLRGMSKPNTAKARSGKVFSITQLSAVPGGGESDFHLMFTPVYHTGHCALRGAGRSLMRVAGSSAARMQMHVFARTGLGSLGPGVGPLRWLGSSGAPPPGTCVWVSCAIPKCGSPVGVLTGSSGGPGDGWEAQAW
eukprot:CAMPEP_0204273208 /NCGR_PEP_ID=MMETSP0468-20130131/22839_1 /ASSEMBLY_ACC=CAM_ASM_000383 /TAXON_ID=2969 /ORGANISM="Oxyrrhis marina" /LENGTH=165 /DNA_ID=CAMNT_0051249185 /DNA_START=139 /DNA_END=637 /DNA_ORIENTATION=+